MVEIVECKSELEWLDWLETRGAALAREKRDVRVLTHTGFPIFGSVGAASSSRGTLTVASYGEQELRAAIPVEHIVRIEVHNSRRLRPDRAYSQMREMEQALPQNNISARDTHR